MKGSRNLGEEAGRLEGRLWVVRSAQNMDTFQINSREELRVNGMWGVREMKDPTLLKKKSLLQDWKTSPDIGRMMMLFTMRR